MKTSNNTFHELIVTVAKQAISDRLNQTSTLNRAVFLELYPECNIPKATFVTLTLNHQLRGCIGSLVAHRSLLDDLIGNAQAAAFDDPRFYPLSPEEFLHVNIEVSLLSEPERVLYETMDELKSKITLGGDGIILQQGVHKATFLPQVWEQLPTFELFFSHLCQKAGLAENCLQNHPDIWRYKVEKITQ